MIFKAENLWVHYQRVEALKGVSITVEQGSIVALIGANGAGKSTLLKTVSGLIRPTSGTIQFQGKSIDHMPPHKISRLGVAQVPEGKRLYSSMTVLENLYMGAYTVSDKEKINMSLKRIYQHFPVLEKKRMGRAGSLSGGEQQMLATARALMADPKLLLMDEPTLGLSPLLVQEVRKMILDINKEGVSIILVEQNAKMALRLAQYAYVLEVGTVALEGPAPELLNNEHVARAYLGG